MAEEGTQKFYWKKAKLLINDEFVDKLIDFKVLGQKTDVFQPYQKINFIERNLSDIDPLAVEEFNMCFGRLYRWLLLAVETRKGDIIRRKALISKEREERDFKIKAKDERARKREADLEEAKQKFDEDHREEIEAYEAWKKQQEKGGEEYGDEEEEEEEGEEKVKEPPVLPEFNEEEFLEKWDEETPEIVIQESIADEIDNDWDLTQEEIEEHIRRYWERLSGE